MTENELEPRKMPTRVDIRAYCYLQAYIDELKKVRIDESGEIGVFMLLWTSAEKW